jgi:hypothetical protein
MLLVGALTACQTTSSEREASRTATDTDQPPTSSLTRIDEKQSREQPAWRASQKVQLRWFAKGSRVLVDWTIVRDVTSGTWHRLPQRTRVNEFSPDGAHVVRIESYEREMRVVPWDESGGDLIRIPEILDRDELPEKALPEAYGSWLDEDQILVFESTTVGPHLDCMVYDIESKSWQRPPAGCPRGPFHVLREVERGPGDLLAVYAAAEGHPAVDVIRYTPADQSETSFPMLDIYPYGPPGIRFTGSEDTIWVETPCELDARPCKQPKQSNPTAFLYRWTAQGGMEVVDDDIPSGARFDPFHSRFAWAYDGELCVGKRPNTGEYECWESPR